MKIESLSEIPKLTKYKVWLIAENIRSAYNVGALLRTADGTGITGIIMAGYTPDGDHFRVHKTSLNAEQYVPWIAVPSAKEAIVELQKLSIPTFALELVPNAVSVFDYVPENYPIAICLGNEVEGVSQEVLKTVNKVLMIPMEGQKESLNVAEAGSITMYEFFRKTIQ